MDKKNRRNSPCPGGCGKKVKYCICSKTPSRRWVWMLLLAMVIVSVVGPCFRLMGNTENDEPKSTTPTSEETIVRLVIHEGDGFLGQYVKDGALARWITADSLTIELSQNMIEDMIYPMIQEIFYHYPIPSLRREFAKLWTNPKMKILIWFDPDANDADAQLGAAEPSAKVPGQTIILLDARSIRRQAFKAQRRLKPAQARRSIVDTLMAVSLHEKFHAIKHCGAWGRKTSTPEKAMVLAAEIECWAYTCHDVIAVMKEHGRGTLIPGTTEFKLYKVYVKLNGNTSSPEWAKAVKDMGISKNRTTKESQ